MSAWGKSWGRAWGRSWGPIVVAELPEDEAPIQPGAFAPLSRAASPISLKPFQRRSRKRRDQEFLLLL